jgi:type IV pilus assembly protein PilM
MPLEPGVVAAGEVRDSGALATALKRFFAQNRLPRSGVRLGVATNRIGVRMLEVPAVDDPKLLENAIRFRAQEVLPFPLADAVLDHVLLGEMTDDAHVKQQRVLLVFAHRELVEGYLDACQRAGLKLVGIDFEAFALLRALSPSGGAETGNNTALVAVAIGRERTIFAVSDGATCDFARVLEWGGASLDAALAAALKIEPEEAERLKRSLGLDGEAASESLSATEVEVARAALREELQVLARELVSSLQFYQSRPESLDIGEVLLTGGGAQLGGIDDELARQLGVPIRLADPLGRVTADDSFVIPGDAGSVAIAVGLGIES